MGYYVHIHVAFACDTNEGVAALAKKHLLTIGDDCNEARWFLEALSGRTGNNPGPKGGLSLWGIIGNYSDGEKFVEVLKSFWTELLTGEIDGGPCSHENIVVMVEREQTEWAEAIQIGCEDGKLEIKRCERLPFAWMQY